MVIRRLSTRRIILLIVLTLCKSRQVVAGAWKLESQTSWPKAYVQLPNYSNGAGGSEAPLVRLMYVGPICKHDGSLFFPGRNSQILF